MNARALLQRASAVRLLIASLIAVSSVIPANASTVAICNSADLSGKATGSGAGMSQPYVVITVTNIGKASCALKGYPVLTGAWTAKGKVAISAKNGDLFNMPSAKVKRFVLAPKAKAWFANGSATAYDPPLVTINRIAFATSAGTSVADSSMIRSGLMATAPAGKPYPLGVTAFAAGKGPASGCDSGNC
ncbi:MAG: DUF4232 domain-containing protein [Actinomycetota bacterium]|nr:DUF4232 domain-containing protein [Actinomycetota bacterium]